MHHHKRVLGALHAKALDGLSVRASDRDSDWAGDAQSINLKGNWI